MKHLNGVSTAEQETIYPAGRHQRALVLGNLHIPALILVYSRFYRPEIVRLCKENGSDCDFITPDQGNSRINLKISAADETAERRGPDIPEAKLQLLWKKYRP